MDTSNERPPRRPDITFHPDIFSTRAEYRVIAETRPDTGEAAEAQDHGNT